jgi:hypothetical protein
MDRTEAEMRSDRGETAFHEGGALLRRLPARPPARMVDYPPAKVVWTNCKPELGTYHGALEYKDAYAKLFLKQSPETIESGGYDATKIRAVLDAIVAECAVISMDIAVAIG